MLTDFTKITYVYLFIIKLNMDNNTAVITNNLCILVYNKMEYG